MTIKQLLESSLARYEGYGSNDTRWYRRCKHCTEMPARQIRVLSRFMLEAVVATNKLDKRQIRRLLNWTCYLCDGCYEVITPLDVVFLHERYIRVCYTRVDNMRKIKNELKNVAVTKNTERCAELSAQIEQLEKKLLHKPMYGIHDILYTLWLEYATTPAYDTFDKPWSAQMSRLLPKTIATRVEGDLDGVVELYCIVCTETFSRDEGSKLANCCSTACHNRFQKLKDYLQAGDPFLQRCSEFFIESKCIVCKDKAAHKGKNGKYRMLYCGYTCYEHDNIIQKNAPVINTEVLPPPLKKENKNWWEAL